MGRKWETFSNVIKSDNLMRDIYCEQESTNFLGRQLIDFLLKYFLWVIFYPIYVT